MALVDRKKELAGLVIMTAVLALPALSPGKAGWLLNFVPLPAFYYLVRLGRKKGTDLIRNGILAAGGTVAIFGSLPLFIFVLTLIPLGFLFMRAARGKINPVKTGINGIIILTAIWIAFWTVTGLIHRINPYETLLASLDQGITAVELTYQEAYELPAETRENVKAAILELKRIIPRIMPALLLSGIILIVWANMALGNWLLRRQKGALAPWPEFMAWRLPDNLVWLGIIGGGLTLVFSDPLEIIGINSLITWVTLYLIQGLAVLINLLARWQTPLAFRVLIYGLLILQSYGIILLAVVGLSDVWMDFRRLNRNDEAGKQA